MTKIQILQQGVDPNNFDDKGLPSDVHLIAYTLDGQSLVDAVRAYTMVDIFDHYFDEINGKGKIQSIKQGYGNIRPNLYGKITDEKDKKDDKK